MSADPMTGLAGGRRTWRQGATGHPAGPDSATRRATPPTPRAHGRATPPATGLRQSDVR